MKYTLDTYLMRSLQNPIQNFDKNYITNHIVMLLCVTTMLLLWIF